jgi:hypothetical protein
LLSGRDPGEDAISRIAQACLRLGRAQPEEHNGRMRWKVTMTTRFAAKMILGGVVLAAPGARAAEGFGSPGVAISAERMFGIVSTSTTVKEDGNPIEVTNRGTTVSLLSNSLGPFSSTYSSARLGIDGFVIQGLSVGAALGYVSTSTSTKIENQGSSLEEDGPTWHGFIFAPRVGYAHMFMDLVGIWPRAGITYVSFGNDETNGVNSYEYSSSRLALTLEVPVVISPAPHTAILVGPTLDLGLSGGNESTSKMGAVTTTNEEDAKSTEFGLQAGLAIAF